MSRFLTHNKVQTSQSQICEGDKYPTIGVELTTLSMCISSVFEEIDDNVRKTLCIWGTLDPLFKTIKDTTPEFTERMINMDSLFEFELLDRWVPKDLETCLFCGKRCIDINHNEHLIDSTGFKSIWRYLHVHLYPV